MPDLTVLSSELLPVGPVGRRGLGWWGVGTLVATEGALFAYLLFAYFYTCATAPPGWLLEPHPVLKFALPNTLLLLASSVVAWWGERGVLTATARPGAGRLRRRIRHGVRLRPRARATSGTRRHFRIGTSSYGSLYFVTTGFHMAHVIVGILVLAAIFSWTALDYFSPRRRLYVSAGVLYWHFVDVVWLFVFATYYVTPYLGFGR